MKQFSLAQYLWGESAKLRYLLMCSFFLLFAFLGSREIWTQEDRWATIVYNMFYTHDFLHPYITGQIYNDKPLLSYWLMAIFSKILNAVNTWTLRIPSALSGLLAIWSIYHIGTKLKNQKLGFLAGWLLLSTYYFIFWARVSNTDMMNIAGSLLAIAWYLEKKNNARFIDYVIFFAILAVTALCKGLSGPIISFIAVSVDLSLHKTWRQHLKWTLILSLLPSLTIYFFPFLASNYFGGNNENSLYLVYRENFLRYFQPFDHKGPIYIYLIYLPIYLLPWTILFFSAIFTFLKRFRNLSANSKWIFWTLLLVFLFFTCSGSRRNYYVLPMVPFAILLVADWLLLEPTSSLKKQMLQGKWIAIVYVFIFFVLGVFPFYYYSKTGVALFANHLKHEAEKIRPWNQWNFVLIDTKLKINFYLKLPPIVPTYYFRMPDTRSPYLLTNLLTHKKPANVIFVTRASNLPLLKNYFKGYHIVEDKIPTLLNFATGDKDDLPIAFIPK